MTSTYHAPIGAREESALSLFNEGFDGPGVVELEANGCEWEDEEWSRRLSWATVAMREDYEAIWHVGQ